MKLKTTILAIATVTVGALVGRYMPQPAYAKKLHRVFHSHIARIKPEGIAAFQAVAPNSFKEYTVVVDGNVTLTNGSVRKFDRQTLAQRADGTRVEVFEQIFKHGSSVTRRILPLAGGLTLIRDSLGIKAVIPSPSSDPGYGWAGRLSPGSNCTTSNEMFASTHQTSGDVTVESGSSSAPLPGAVKLTASNGDVRWYHPAWDCAELGGTTAPRGPDDFPSNRLDLVSATPGPPDTALFVMSDKLQEVTLDAFRASSNSEDKRLALGN